eukprot:scaffold776_cov203-Alexandrium_tamarense.AAC.4
MESLNFFGAVQRCLAAHSTEFNHGVVRKMGDECKNGRSRSRNEALNSESFLYGGPRAEHTNS